MKRDMYSFREHSLIKMILYPILERVSLTVRISNTLSVS